MTLPYPVVDQRPLDEAGRRKLLGMRVGSRTRAAQDLPRPSTHEVLILGTNGQYRLGTGFGLSDEEIIKADHVSIVDVSRDKQVPVDLAIPSRDADGFQVMVTFVCTVTDPLVVVKEGINAQSALLSYLKGHHKIVHLGLPYRLAEINEVRIDVEAEIRAIATIAPPVLPGMLISVASVEVATPTELAAFQQKLRDLENTHTLDSLQQGYTQNLDQGQRQYENDMSRAQQDHELRLDEEKARFENAKALVQQQHAHTLAAGGLRNQQELDQSHLLFQNATARAQQEHAHQLADQDHRHTLSLREATNDFALRELEKATAVMGTDPQLALQYAFQAGELNARDLAAGWQGREDRRHDDVQRDRDRQHEIRMLELKWDRETKMRAESDATEEQRFIRAIRADLVRDLIKKGYLETIDPETLAGELLGDLTAGPGAAKAGLPRGNNGVPADPEEDGPSVREEDGD